MKTTTKKLSDKDRDKILVLRAVCIYTGDSMSKVLKWYKKNHTSLKKNL